MRRPRSEAIVFRRTLPWCLLVLLAVGAPCSAGVDSTLKKLIGDLNNPKNEVRLAALDALAELGPAAAPAVAPVIEVLQVGNEDLRLASALALGKIGKAAVPELARLAAGAENATRYY